MSKAYDSPYAHSCSPERSSALERTPANCALGESRAPCAYNSHRTSALERNVGVTHSLKMLNVLRAQGGQAHLAPLAPRSTAPKKYPSEEKSYRLLACDGRPGDVRPLSQRRQTPGC